MFSNFRTILCSGINIDQCKLLKKYSEKIIKSYRTCKIFDFYFIDIKNLFQALKEFIDFYKLNREMSIFLKIFEQIFTEYSIKFHLNSFSGISTKEPLGKM
jgi:hypothetical protein